MTTKKPTIKDLADCRSIDWLGAKSYESTSNLVRQQIANHILNKVNSDPLLVFVHNGIVNDLPELNYRPTYR